MKKLRWMDIPHMPNRRIYPSSAAYTDNHVPFAQIWRKGSKWVLYLRDACYGDPRTEWPSLSAAKSKCELIWRDFNTYEPTKIKSDINVSHMPHGT